jgi:hypothetical protein
MEKLMRTMGTLALCASVQLAPACSKEAAPAATTTMTDGAGDTMIPEAEARRIAAEDAKSAYRQLDSYDVRAELSASQWHVTYTPKAGSVGGGPAYVIDAKSGKIVSKKYYQ